MQLKIHGCRGSLPTSVSQNSIFGNNSSCYSIETEHQILILDAGTGLYNLGLELAKSQKEIFIFLSHYHWDHIQGLTNFKPFMQPNRDIHIISYHDQHLEPTFNMLFDGTHFPLSTDDILSRPTFHHKELPPSLKMKLNPFPINHIGPCHGVKITHNNQSLVYMTDNELPGSYPQIKNCDILVHDCQYFTHEKAHKTGWGHSFVEDLVAFANECTPKTLVLTHHDPEKTDSEIEKIHQEVQSGLKNTSIQCLLASENGHISC